MNNFIKDYNEYKPQINTNNGRKSKSVHRAET